MTELVALDMDPSEDFLVALDAAWQRGDAVLPLQRQAPESHRRSVAIRMGARYLVTMAGSEELAGSRPLAEGDALVMTTSGTTGAPKGVVLTHSAVEYSAYATATSLGIDPGTHWLACLPLSHVGGMSVITRALHTGSELTVQPRFDPDLLTTALLGGATHVSLVHTALRRIDPTPWQRILLGGSAVPADLPPNCVATYGMTETFGGVVYDGLALNGVDVRIAGTRSGEFDVEGPVELLSPTALRCYRGDGDGDELERNALDAEGWFRTGDLGYISGTDRRLSISGRADELIITGGEKVWPIPVEARLEAHPRVAEAAVLGRRDPEWGQAVTALVVASTPVDPPSLQELRDWVREAMPPAAAPRALELVDQLPRTALGKLVRSQLA
jgi:O-succinylbenzoic acid--CoA ligase